MKKLLLIVIMCLLIPNILLAQDASDGSDEDIQTYYVRGQVIEIFEEEIISKDTGIPVGNQKFRVKITDGPYKDKIYMIENTCSGNPVYSYWVTEGERVILVLQIENGKIISYSVDDYERDGNVFYLILLFVIVLILIGRGQGLKAVISLSVTVLVLAKFMLPGLFQGYDPVLLALLTSIVITTITLLIVGGLSMKSLSAILGTSGGLLAAAEISMYFGKITHLRGVSEEEVQILMNTPQTLQLDFNGLLFAGIIIGAVGAIMDVSMSIASSMEEINRAGRMNAFNLIRAGMNVGKDIMGTMTNTLILAYTGASLPLLLYYMAIKPPFIKLMNADYLATEFVRALAGSTGLVLAIPITAVISGILLKMK